MSDPTTPPPAVRPPSRKGRNPLTVVLIMAASFFAVFVMISGFFFLTKTSSMKGSSGVFSGGSVAVLELNGVIMDSKKTIKRLENYEEDDDVKALVVRINSPGGAVAPSQEIYEAVKAFKKPLVVSMGSIAASGGFYIACGAKKVFANPGTITGSIGVIMEFANLGKLYEWAKIHRYSIKTGKYKDAGAEYREMSAEERELFQKMADNVLLQFKTAVAAGRKQSMEKVTAIADGRVFSGMQAKALGLVDELGTMRDAIAAAAKLADLKGKPNVVYPEKSRRKLLDLLLDEAPREESSSESSARSGGVLARVLEWLANDVEPSVTGLGLAPGIYWLWSR